MLISHVIPFFHKSQIFRQLLPLSDCFKLDTSELVLVLDDPDEERDVLEIVQAHPEIKFRVIVNDWKHEWRPPCIAINVGLRYAEAPHVIVHSPETMIVLPHRNYLVELLGRDWRTMYSGILWNVGDIQPEDNEDLVRMKMMVAVATRRPAYSGFLLVHKYSLETICGYDESRTAWGPDDDDVRLRLMQIGTKYLHDPNIRVFHSWHDDVDRSYVKGSEPDKNLVVLHGQRDTWGKAFHRVTWDWRKL